MIRRATKTRWLPWAAVTAAFACLALAPAATAARSHPHKPHAPKQRPLYWGAWIGKQMTGTEPPWDMSAVSRFEATVHKSLSLLEFSAPFADCSVSPCVDYPFPTQEMQNVRNYGAIPFFSWNSGASGGGPEADFSLAQILSGRYDSYIHGFAEAARAWGHPFFLRFDWEMNGDWFPWSAGINGNTAGGFVSAWRHVHDIFTSVGATNATWVWCPYADAQRRLKPLASFYPGDSYVDWTCLDGFNWGKNGVNPLPWRSFDDIFKDPYKQIVTKIAPGKPMMLAEMASGGSGRPKATWIKGMFRQLAKGYRQIRGLIWFDQVDRGVQWPLEASGAVSRTFSSGLRRQPYLGNRFGNISASPIPAPK